MYTLTYFHDFVNEIKQNNSRNYKIEVLKKYKDDETIRYLLDFIYNPYIVTGLSTKKLQKDVSADSSDYFETFKELLEYLKVHNTGRDEDIAKVRYFEISHVGSWNMICFLRAIISKDIQLGVDVKTINKVMPGLIPEFNVMLANKYFDDPTIVEGKHFALTTKIDGGRIIALKENGVVSFYTRAGQKYEGLVDLEQELLNLPYANICFDGEITLLSPYKIEFDENDQPAVAVKLTSKEQYKETMKITRKDGEKHGVKMLVFDVMYADQFKNQKCENSYYERRAFLNQIFIQSNLTYFENLPMLYEGYDTNEIIKWLNYNIQHGEEGVMINLVDAPYEFKRTNSLLKVKKMNDLDLEIIGFEEGTGKNIGKLGALLVSYKNNIVKVGSGFSDQLRKEIWENQSDWLGRTVIVQYFEETYNSITNLPSLRFPVYIDYREDK